MCYLEIVLSESSSVTTNPGMVDQLKRLWPAISILVLAIGINVLSVGISMKISSSSGTEWFSKSCVIPCLLVTHLEKEGTVFQELCAKCIKNFWSLPLVLYNSTTGIVADSQLDSELTIQLFTTPSAITESQIIRTMVKY